VHRLHEDAREVAEQRAVLGAFDPKSFAVRDGESIHFHGPGRAAGVPVVAGLVLYEEAMAGESRHELATPFNAYQEFVPPATWTDGVVPGGIPEGAVLQIDPALDLSRFDLTPQERAVAVAAPRYGDGRLSILRKAAAVGRQSPLMAASAARP
jgi:hypothetical protein